MSCKFLLAALIVFGFVDAAFANWWIVRSADEKCLVVDIEPSGKGVTKVGKEYTNTGASRSRRQRALQRTKCCGSHFHPRQGQVRFYSARPIALAMFVGAFPVKLVCAGAANKLCIVTGVFSPGQNPWVTGNAGH